MGKRSTDNNKKEKAVLRRRAKPFLGERRAERADISVHDLHEITHELEVHQIELKIQNEELRKARLELEQAHKKYMDLYEHAPVGYFTLNPDCRILKVNLAGASLLGFERQTLTTKAFTELIDRDSQDTFYILKNRTLETGTHQTCELRLVKKDKTPIYCQLESLPEKVHDDEPRQLRIAVIDISARKKVEVALEGSEERYQMLFEKAKDAILLLETTPKMGRIVAANPAAGNLYGYTVYELLVRNITDLVSSDAINGISDLLRRINAGEWINQEIYGLKKDGTIIPVDISSELINFGKERFILAFERDITERKKAESLLQKSGVMLQCVFDGISEPLVMLNRALRVKMLNKAARKYYRVENHDRVLNRPCRETLASDFIQCENCLIASAIQQGNRVSFERMGLLDPNRIEQVTFFPVKDVGGKPGGIIQIVDVTEKKGVEKILNRADRLASLGQLSGGIAHEIRNPLSGISLFVDILADEEKFSRSEKESQILKEIKQNVRKIDGIIQGVLGFARNSSVKSSLLDINTVTEETLRLWQTKMINNGIRLDLSLGKNISSISGDVIGIQQVVHNLVQNAVEAMGSGGVLGISTQMGLSSYRKDREVVIIKVQDTGPGIEPGCREDIFNPFFTTKPDGTGLGLAITHQIVKQHGGVITCESKPGKGTVFCFELPTSPSGVS